MPEPRSAVAEVLLALRTAFDELGADWYLFGAQAALVYGAARLTADVDVTAQLGDMPTETLVRALRKQRIELRLDDRTRRS